MVCVLDVLRCWRWSDLELEVVEALWVEIKVKKINILCTMYHPPKFRMLGYARSV